MGGGGDHFRAFFSINNQEGNVNKYTVAALDHIILIW